MSGVPAHERTIAGGRRVRQLEFAGPAGRLEGVLFCRVHERPPAAAVICHPHPRMGGTMHNKVAYRTAEAVFAHGLPTLRFNFRGAGRSQGEWSGGPGEEEDAAAALDLVASLYSGRPLLLGGFSFGGGVALSLGARDPRVTALLAVAPAVRGRDLAALARSPKPKGVIQGTADELCPLEELRAAYPGWGEPKAVRLVAGAGHFFDGRLGELAAAVHSLLEELAMARALGLGGAPAVRPEDSP